MIFFNRCTVSNDCPSNVWQRESNQCIHIINVNPLNVSIDQTQWVCVPFFSSLLLKQLFIFLDKFNSFKITTIGT